MISGDTTPCEPLQVAAHRADLLIHEATFAEEERERAAETGHSTAAQAATIARDADVGCSRSRTSQPAIRSDCSETRRGPCSADCAPARLRHDRAAVSERGEPELVHWDERRMGEDAEPVGEELAAP